jgi:hypothetical protein
MSATTGARHEPAIIHVECYRPPEEQIEIVERATRYCYSGNGEEYGEERGAFKRPAGSQLPRHYHAGDARRVLFGRCVR